MFSNARDILDLVKLSYIILRTGIANAQVQVAKLSNYPAALLSLSCQEEPAILLLLKYRYGNQFSSPAIQLYPGLLCPLSPSI